MPRRQPAALVVLVLGTAAAVTAAVVGVGPAAADSYTARERALATQLSQLHRQQSAMARLSQATAARLTALNTTAELDAEAFDAARVRLAGATAIADAAARRLLGADRRVATLQRGIGVFAAQAYESGGLGSLEVVSGDAQPATLLDQLAALDAVARGQSDLLQTIRIARYQQASAAAADRLAVAAQQRVVDQIAAARARVERDAALTTTLLGRLHAKQGALAKAADKVVAEAVATRRAAAAAAARRAAELAARRAAELAAQQRAAAAAAAAFRSEPTGGSPGPPPNQAPPANAAAIAVSWAYRELGKPYVWGAAGPDAFDCSGLTQYVWAQAGVFLPHYTGDQWNSGAHVSMADLRPGDLVFFFPPTLHHVGIYVGNGWFIDAPRAGTVVQLAPLAGFWSSVYAGAVDPLG